MAAIKSNIERVKKKNSIDNNVSEFKISNKIEQKQMKWKLLGDKRENQTTHLQIIYRNKSPRKKEERVWRGGVTRAKEGTRDKAQRMPTSESV